MVFRLVKLQIPKIDSCWVYWTTLWENLDCGQYCFQPIKFMNLVYITHSGMCLTRFPNTMKFVKNTPLCMVFSTLFSVFGNLVKHRLSCLIYCIKEPSVVPSHCSCYGLLLLLMALLFTVTSLSGNTFS